MQPLHFTRGAAKASVYEITSRDRKNILRRKSYTVCWRNKHREPRQRKSFTVKADAIAFARTQIKQHPATIEVPTAAWRKYLAQMKRLETAMTSLHTLFSKDVVGAATPRPIPRFTLDGQ